MNGYELSGLTIAGIALGSNLGKSQEILTTAIKELKKMHEGSLDSFLVSSFYKTAPVNCPPGSPHFLNAVIQLATSQSPHDLLTLFQAMEKKTGRPFPHSKNDPRTLDLDLLYYGKTILMTPQLELPHPRIRERSFVLAPLAEIAPQITLPGWSQTALYYLHLLHK